MQLIKKYFAKLSYFQNEKFDKLAELYKYWNSLINVISRKDIDHLYLHHVLHSLSIAKVLQFTDGTKIMDAGTGGGFPGIPLAIMFPEVQFTLVDSIAKKQRVVEAIIKELELENCSVKQERIEKVKGKFDFIVSRAVSSIPIILKWIRHCIHDQNKNLLNNGLICLKGGNMKKELESLNYNYKVFDINSFFLEEYFESKKVVYIDLAGNSLNVPN
jgi:16S rRNA (guanine527-N7)-methyltransferase